MTAFGLTILAIILFVAAIIFLVAELFLPTFGLLAIGSGACAIAGVVIVSWIDATLGLIAAVVLVVAAPFVIYKLIISYPKTMVGKRMLLEKPMQQTENTVDSALLGSSGKTITMLRPAGVVDIRGKRVDCVSEGDVIDAGKNVTVVSVNSGRIVVRETPAEENPKSAT